MGKSVFRNYDNTVFKKKCGLFAPWGWRLKVPSNYKLQGVMETFSWLNHFLAEAYVGRRGEHLKQERLGRPRLGLLL